MNLLEFEILILVIAGAISRKAGGAIANKAGGRRGRAIIGSMAGSAIGAAIGVPASYFAIAITAVQPPAAATIVSWWIPMVGITGIAGAIVGMIAGLIIGLIAEAFDVISPTTSGSSVITRHSVIAKVGATIGGVLSTLLCIPLVILFAIG